MAPKAGKAKPHKAKGEKKKKEEKVLPTVIEISVETPESQVTLKVRGPKLKDSVEIVSLKPCHLTMVEEQYTEEQIVAHIRRLLDIVACTTSFGGSSSSPKCTGRTGSKDPGSSLSDASETKNTKTKGAEPKKPDIRRSSRPFLEDKTEDDYFQIDVRVCSGKPTTIVASSKGFYPAGKRILLSHTLVGLLQQLSRVFDAAYKALMKAFTEHNKFGNLPYGFRANTWVVPPFVAENPSNFPPLPTEDENWGGNGGGQGRDGKHDYRPWAKEFAILAAMPCKTDEERQIRDRKAFLLHSLFVDVSVTKAVAAIKCLVDGVQGSPQNSSSSTWYEERFGDLLISIKKDAQDASRKTDNKNDGTLVLDMPLDELARRNLLKGITADGSATVHHAWQGAGYLNRVAEIKTGT
nr:protein TSS [Ipomoea batatas]